MLKTQRVCRAGVGSEVHTNHTTGGTAAHPIDGTASLTTEPPFQRPTDCNGATPNRFVASERAVGVVDNEPDERRADATNPDRSAEGTDSLSDHPVLFGLITGGYVLGLVGGLIAAWAVPYLLGYQLDWTRQATGVFAADGAVVRSLFRVAFTSFPIVFAVCTVAVDLIALRSLTDRSIPNSRGLAAWTLLAVFGLGAMLSVINPILPPYGLVQLLSAPVFGFVAVVIVTITGAVAGVAGRSIPVDLTRGRMSFVAAGKRAVAEFRATPIAVLRSSRPIVVGWGVGSGLLFVGIGSLGLALGIPFIGILLLPVVPVILGIAAIAFAGGHLRYRLTTVSNASHG